MSEPVSRAVSASAGHEVDEDARLAGLHQLLEDRRLGEVAASIMGSRREIVAFRAPVELASELAELAPAIKRLGFLYVTLDLDAGEVEQ